MNYEQLATQIIEENYLLSDEEALAILETPQQDLLKLLEESYQILYHYYGNKVKLNMIINTKSGLCPENCGYCSQSIISKAPIEN